LVTAFHALQDTKTPVKIAVFCLGLNAALNFILMIPLKIGGIALASAIAGSIDFLALFYLLNKRLGKFNSGLLIYFLKVTFAALLTGIFADAVWVHAVLPNEFTKLCAAGFSGFFFYGLICLFLQVEQAHKIVEWIKRGLRRR
ncbi:MAG: polysaccharide biosynthesis C-terminal domain-containing protein, partial [Candidatus Omnitrophica bacterium]|nr:polysaccharide biosynthesis C-terminal domain-containing protein [Candidatus Omnitrophota bacterium]